MDLTKINTEIPKDIRAYCEEKAGNTSSIFVSWLVYRYGEIVERVFAARRYKQKGVLITEVERRATGKNDAICKNLLFSGIAGYIPVYEKKDKVLRSCGYPIKVFYKEDFDLWYLSTGQHGYHTVVINKEYLSSVEEFKYCGYSGGNVIDYLNRYREDHSLEMFGKLGLPLYKSLLSKAKEDKLFAKFLFKNAEKVRNYGPQATLDAYKKNRDIGVSYLEIEQNKLALKYISELKDTDLNRIRVINYCDDNDVDYFDYNDYLKAIKVLGYNLSDTKNVFPEDFDRMHDMRTAEYDHYTAEQDRKKRRNLYKSFAKAAKKASIYAMEDDKFMIFPASTITKLKEEGKALHHCVARMGYDTKMASGRVVIMFVRLKDDKDTPYITVEYDLKNGRLCQARGKYNSAPNEETLAFIQQWEEYIKTVRKEVA